MYEVFNTVCSQIKAQPCSFTCALDDIGPVHSPEQTAKFKDCLTRMRNNPDSYRAISPISENDLPSWYRMFSVNDAIYHELWGWNVAAEWIYGYPDIETFIIQDHNCFILRDGHQKLMKQRVSDAFLKKLNDEFADGSNSVHFTLDGIALCLEYLAPNSFVFTKKIGCNPDCTVTKQDVAVALWNLLNDHPTGMDLCPDDIVSSGMRKTNSFDVRFVDGSAYKVIVKRLKDDDDDSDCDD